MAKEKEGTLRKRADGKWEARCIIGYDSEGKAIRKSFYGSKPEAKKKMEAAMNQFNQGMDLISDNISILAWATEWFEIYHKPNLRPASIEITESILRLHISASPIAGYKISDIKTHHIQKYLNEIAKEKGPTTVKRIRRLLIQSLEQAKKNKLILDNPAKDTILPKTLHSGDEEETFEYLSVEEQNKLMNHLLNLEKDAKLKACVLLALGTGIRIGELCALRDSDVDLDQAVIKINGSIRWIKGELIIQPPKTKNGFREIPCPRFVIDALKTYKAYRIAEQLKAGPLYSSEPYTFFRAPLGGPTDPRNLRRSYQRLLSRLEMNSYDFHSIRHTYATRLLESGENPKTVSKLLGHHDITITLRIYSHVSEETKKSAADKLDKMFYNK